MTNEQIYNKINLFLNSKIDSKKVIELFYEIGEILNKNHYNYYQLMVLDSYLRNKYGLIISLSKKNLIKIQKFYQISKDIDKKTLIQIDWNSYLLLITKDNYLELIDIVIKNHFNKRELEYYLKTGKILRITMNYGDPATDEFLKLQQNLKK